MQCNIYVFYYSQINSSIQVLSTQEDVLALPKIDLETCIDPTNNVENIVHALSQKIYGSNGLPKFIDIEYEPKSENKEISIYYAVYIHPERLQSLKDVYTCDISHYSRYPVIRKFLCKI